MTAKQRELVSAILALALLFTLLQGAGFLLLPELDVSGTNWKSYQKEPEQSIQVLFVGSSVVFCNISPAVIYRESGITSYLIAGPEQSMPVSYYYIREACKTQKPDAIFVELKGLFFPQYGDYTVANLVFLPRGVNRFEAMIKTARREDLPGLLFPVLDYHERWNDLTLGELRERLKPAQVSSNAGYMPLYSLQEQREINSFHPDGEYIAECVRYLRKIDAYCTENGIALYLFFAPVTNTVDKDTKDWIAALTQELKIAGYFDFSTEESFRSIGLKLDSDWSDDLHLNTSGAEQFSIFLGRFLLDKGIPSNKTADQILWRLRVEDFE